MILCDTDVINKRKLNQISRDIVKLNLIHINKEIGDRFKSKRF